MKKLFALILAGALAASSLTACGSTAVVAVPQPEATTPPAAEPAQESTPESSGAAVKTGFYLGTDISGSKSAAAEEEGVAQANLELVAVTLTDEGVIDAIQSKINFDATGAITTDLTAPVLSKNELGDGYGMKKASSIGKEWNEQAAAFSAYVVGKTPEEVSGIAVNEKGGAADSDLAASVTISIGQFQALIAKAGA